MVKLHISRDFYLLVSQGTFFQNQFYSFFFYGDNIASEQDMIVECEFGGVMTERLRTSSWKMEDG